MTSIKRYSIFLLSQRAMLYLLCFTSLTAFSQNSLSIFGGISNNYLQTNYSNRLFTKVQSKIGYSVGASFQYGLNKKLALCAGVTALQKNYAIVRTGDYSGAYGWLVRNYIMVPFYLRWQTGIHKFAINIDCGAFGAWWASGRLRGSVPDIFSAVNNGNTDMLPLRPYNEDYEFLSTRDRRVEWGGILATGGSYRIKQKYAAFINLGYFHALTGDQKKYSINQTQNYNRTIVASAGIKFSIK